MLHIAKQWLGFELCLENIMRKWELIKEVKDWNCESHLVPRTKQWWLRTDTEILKIGFNISYAENQEHLTCHLDSVTPSPAYHLDFVVSLPLMWNYFLLDKSEPKKSDIGNSDGWLIPIPDNLHPIILKTNWQFGANPGTSDLYPALFLSSLEQV